MLNPPGKHSGCRLQCQERRVGFSSYTMESLLWPSRSLPCSLLAVPFSNVYSSIVAVHGLCGDPFETWTDDTTGKLWLRDFLPSQIPNTRVMSYGYDSFSAFSKSEIELGDVAAVILNRLNDERGTHKVK